MLTLNLLGLNFIFKIIICNAHLIATAFLGLKEGLVGMMDKSGAFLAVFRKPSHPYA